MSQGKGKGIGWVALAYLVVALTAVGGFTGQVLARNPSVGLLRVITEMVESSGLAESMEGGAEQLAQLQAILAMTDSAAAPGAWLSILVWTALLLLLAGLVQALMRLQAAGVDDLGAPPLVLAITGPLGMARVEQAAKGAARSGAATWRAGRALPLATALAVLLPLIALRGLDILAAVMNRLPEKGLDAPPDELEAWINHTLVLSGGMIVLGYLIAYAGWHWLWSVHKALRRVPVVE